MARDYREEARELLQFELQNHPDPGVRAIALAFDPPEDAVERVAETLRKKAEG